MRIHLLFIALLLSASAILGAEFPSMLPPQHVDPPRPEHAATNRAFTGTDRSILMSTFREEDAAQGTAVSDDVVLRQLISKASGGQEKVKATTKPIKPTP